VQTAPSMPNVLGQPASSQRTVPKRLPAASDTHRSTHLSHV